MNALTPEDLAALYGDGWRFGCYGADWRFDRRGGTWIAVDQDGHRYEASGAVDLADKIASGRTVCR